MLIPFHYFFVLQTHPLVPHWVKVSRQGRYYAQDSIVPSMMPPFGHQPDRYEPK